MASDLTSQHLARLHALAAELGVPGFRALRREELITAIEAAGGGTIEAVGVQAAAPAENATPPEDSEQVLGVLDLTSQGHGFLRLAGLERGEDDVYVSASQVRRCELRVGDEVAGPARPPRRGERHRALVHVDTVNGSEPQPAERSSFDSLTPALPTRRLALAADDVLVRTADLLAPLALGQRVLVRAAPRSGRTTFLRGLAAALESAGGVELIVLLIDERPEEAASWRQALPEAELAIATAEMSPAEQLRVAELAIERARRRAESGADAVLVVDSLSRLAAAAGDTAPAKRLFGSGREIEGEKTGSLTVIATTIDDGDAGAAGAVATTENAVVALSAELASAGVVPAIEVSLTAASNEDRLLSEEELSGLRALRAELAGLEPAAAAARLRELIEGSASNSELLAGLV